MTKYYFVTENQLLLLHTAMLSMDVDHYGSLANRINQRSRDFRGFGLTREPFDRTDSMEMRALVERNINCNKVISSIVEIVRHQPIPQEAVPFVVDNEFLERMIKHAETPKKEFNRFSDIDVV